MGNLLIFNLETNADGDVLGFTTDWINALAPKYEKVFVITMQAGRLALKDNVSVHSVGREKGRSEFRRAISFYRILARILRENRIEACFAHMMPLFAVMAWPVLKPAGIPILLWYAHKKVTPLLRVSARLVDGVVASTRSGFQIHTPKLRLIGQGIDVDRFRPSPSSGAESSGLRILTMGRIARIKKLEVLIRAIAHVKILAPELKLEVTVAGGPQSADDGEYLRELEAEVRQLHLDREFRFIGPIAFHQVGLCYREADCFVNTSDTQSLDKAILEAMSCGLPILSSNLALKDVLSGPMAADWLVAQGDIDALGAGIVKLGRMTHGERRELGGKLRQVVVSGHSLEALANKIFSELERLGLHKHKEKALTHAVG